MDLTHEQHMLQALELAAQGVGTTSPNPPVGALIVAHGRIIGRGFHEKAGQEHAERRAIADARSRPKDAAQLAGSSIYVTLEPCSSQGRTPPCTEAIIEAGITTVYYGSTDPDKRHQGRAKALLEKNGVTVHPGLCEAACDHFLRFWTHAHTKQQAWVIAKIATTLDGRLSRKDTRYLSGAETRGYVHDLRATCDAILVGGNCLRQDDPALTLRDCTKKLSAHKQQPWRIILSKNPQALAELECKCLCDEHAEKTLLLGPCDDLPQLLHQLYCDYGITRLMLECGGNLLQEFLAAGLVHEWVQIITPHLAGGPHQVVPQATYLPQEAQLIESSRSLEFMGKDIILRGDLTYRA